MLSFRRRADKYPGDILLTLFSLKSVPLFLLSLWLCLSSLLFIVEWHSDFYKSHLLGVKIELHLVYDSPKSSLKCSIFLCPGRQTSTHLFLLEIKMAFFKVMLALAATSSTPSGLHLIVGNFSTLIEQGL